jgi:hypothetical protein
MFMYIINNAVVVTLVEDPTGSLPLVAEFESPGLVDILLDELFGDTQIRYSMEKGKEMTFTPLGFDKPYNCYTVRAILDMWVYNHDMLLAGDGDDEDGIETLIGESTSAKLHNNMLDDLLI